MPAQAFDFTYSCQASAEHFQQCAEFPLLRNRGLRRLAVTVLPIALARRGTATPFRRRVIDSGPFSSPVSGRVSRSWPGLTRLNGGTP
jgi:hypothetical protein